MKLSSKLSLIKELEAMKNNPYKFEIIGAYIIGPLVMGIEAWRRWGDFLNPAFFDDYFYFLIAMFAAYLLYKRKYMGQLLWLYSTGIGTFMIYFSFFSALHNYDKGDISGISMPKIIAFKGVGVALITLVSYRAIKFLRTAAAGFK